jgi:serine protease Do
MHRTFLLSLLLSCCLFFDSFAVPTKPATSIPSPSSATPSLAELGKAHEIAKALGNVFAAVAEKVSPSVVVINVTRLPVGPESFGMGGGMEDPQGEPFDFFYKGPNGPRRAPPIPHDSGESQGSGFIVRPDGYIYTNNHVIQGADKIKVKLKDGRSFDAKVVGIPDEKTDVAVIKIEAKNLPFAELGDSDEIRPGEWTIAIGAPFNLDYSVTVGVLSGKIRDRLGATAYEEYLQTQATINPGNSGGPLLDIDGRVIGISTLIKTRQAGFNFYNANVGFAIPIKLAQKIGNLLITKGKVERPWIGVDIKTLSEATELKSSIKAVEDGVLIMAIRPETPAYRSGLEPLDVITSIDGVPVKGARELQRQVLEKQIGQIVHLVVVRDGKPVNINVKTDLQPFTQPVASRIPSPQLPLSQSYGITVQPLPKEMADQFDIADKQGVLITEVEEESSAARSGLTAGMIITKVDGKKVASPQALKEALKKSDPKQGAALQVVRDGIRSFVILRLSPVTAPTLEGE